LLDREIGYERETGKYKIGDGITLWNDLPYGNNIVEINAIKDLSGQEVQLTSTETTVALEGATIIGDTRERTFSADDGTYAESGNIATGKYAMAIGRISDARGKYAVALGSRCKAYGDYAFASGNGSIAGGLDEVGKPVGTNNVAMGG
jgi:hypothetical protein